MVDPLYPVTFGEAGLKGDPGTTGVPGPLGGTPNANGTIILDPNANQIRSVRSIEVVKGGVPIPSVITTIATTYDPLVSTTMKPCKIVFECMATSGDESKTQTLDGARKVHMVAGVPTLVVSGTDIADDTQGLGAVWTIEIYSPAGAGTYAFRVRVTAADVFAAVAIRVLTK